MSTEAPARSARPSAWRRRILAWGLASCAFAFVASVVPLRDRCEEPRAADDPSAAVDTPPSGEHANAPRYVLTREGGACTLHRSQGDLALDAGACGKLTCEPGLLSTIARVRLAELFGLLALYVFGTWVWAARWRTLLTLAGVRLGLVETWRVTLESQAGGILLPGGVGGDALRVGFVVARGGTLARVLAAVILDRFLGLSGLSILAAGLAFFLGGGELGPVAVFLALIPVGVAGGLVCLRLERVRAVASGHRLLGPVVDYVGDPAAPRAILRAAGLAAIVAATQLAVIRGIVHALEATPGAERWVFIGGTMSFIAGAIPALPGGWGTADAAYVFFFKRAGLAGSVALTVSLLYRLFWYSVGAAGAVLYLLRSHGPSKVPTAHPAPGATGGGVGERKA